MTHERRLVPASRADFHKLLAVPAGFALRTRADLGRDYARRARFHALCEFVAENHPHFTIGDDVERWLKYRTGLCREMVTVNGRVMLEMRSTTELDDGEFAEWTARARLLIFAELFPTLNEARDLEDIERTYAWM